MMDALAYAVAMAAANAAAATPPGGGDLAHYQGQIVSWDEASGLNSVRVNGAIVSNLRVIRGGIGLAYQPGDTVLIEKRMSQWYILGNVGAPGAGAANQIQSALVAASEATGSTSFTDLATVGPSVTVYIGSSRRALVLVSAYIVATGTASSGTALGGRMSPQVSGASTIAADNTLSASLAAVTDPSGFAGAGVTATFLRLYTAADGLNVGMNTFTSKYNSRLSSPTCAFASRNLTVIPF
ncbi:hypothetical protein QRX60_17050 [Amycolatopsis mongoliensis]|uniref:Minor tail protein n=1 Tax=Amycolatopsis mongoliensis TaxID=715475 RepID=A0A9Y2JXT3_9PSEU|nr:hypothetical protein [Amycolatopsis sp. 4-36]WIY05467.1 hypothetical protein QRX60_17050 [Amycolatopsis sp. 4-36]